MLGELYHGDRFVSHTFELPWRDNQSNISCVPAGLYKIKQVYSAKLKRRVFTLLDVEKRLGIHIHAANKASDIQGCIAPFIHAQVLENGEFFGLHSGEALRAVESVINAHDIRELMIIDPLVGSDSLH